MSMLRRPFMCFLARRLSFWALAILSSNVLSVQAAVVIQYHHVSEKTPASTSISPNQFIEHLDYLVENNFKVVPLTTLVNALKEGQPLPEKTVAITFDDAYESVYSEAYPLLKARNMPFTVFVNTDPQDEAKRGFITWQQLKAMSDEGVLIANHSTAHNHLLRLKLDESEQAWAKRITYEVDHAEAQIKKHTGQSHKILAYPYGEYDQRTKKLLKKLGYVAFGQQSGPLGGADDWQSLPRFPFGGSFVALSDFAIKVNTRPLPNLTVNLFKRDKQKLNDVVVKEGDRPELRLTLADHNIAKAIRCYASGQGATTIELKQNTVVARASQPLKIGRARYNCTAFISPGVFYWYTQQFLVTDKTGQFLHES